MSCPQVVSPRYSNYAEAWETGVRRIYNVAGQVAHHLSNGYFVIVKECLRSLSQITWLTSP